VDPAGVTLASGQRVEADYLVLATGSNYAYPAKPKADSTREALDDLCQTHTELADANPEHLNRASPGGRINNVSRPRVNYVSAHTGEQLLPAVRPQMRQDLHRHARAHEGPPP
jgi:NADPH-dependent 2,4-dienoyl-CoA reductase/sulfur reductase-like enzyme